jgi:glycerol-3-phosphate dehydrogenase
MEDLGRWFGADLYEAELRFLAEREWARTGEDVLWRRTKRGLKLSREEALAVDAFMREIADERRFMVGGTGRAGAA